jgi:hypothetical protein
MRNILVVVGVAGLLGLFSACGGDDRAGVLPEGTGGSGKGGVRPAAGSSSRAGTGADGGAGGASDGEDALAPSVKITSPVATADPNDENVLSGDEVTVNCTVTESVAVGSSKVNTASVKLAILGANDKVIEEKGGVPTAKANEYSYTFSLTTVPAGLVSFRCQAEDTDKHVGTTTLSSLLDKGPTITIVEPEADSLQALSQPLDLEFTVAAAPLTKDDDKAEVDTVTLAIGGQPIDLAAASDKPGHYRLQVNLADAKLFNPSPNGPTPITVEATNKRKPKPVKASSERSTSVDGVGPAIAIIAPLQKAVVGGTVKLTFSVSDKVAGIDPKTVIASLNMVEHRYDPDNDSWSVTGDTYTFSFDSRQVEDAKVQITVNVGAADKVGNVSTGASELLYLDNYPPVIDLDPFNIRTRSISAGAKCSNSFDPVGIDTKNDLDVVARAGIFRAIVVDQTNTIEGIPVAHFSSTRPESVTLYFNQDVATPLLIDTDNNGTCDDVAEVESKDSLQFGPVPKGGTPWFQTDDDVLPTATSLGCETKADPQKPDNLCTNHKSDMWYVIEDPVNQTPVVYASSPTNGLECTGVGWEFGAKVKADGWVCFATRAVDYAGNVGISRPLRICVDDPERAATPPCANSSVTAPTCTDGCTAPPRWGNGLVEQL